MGLSMLAEFMRLPRLESDRPVSYRSRRTKAKGKPGSFVVPAHGPQCGLGSPDLNGRGEEIEKVVVGKDQRLLVECCVGSFSLDGAKGSTRLAGVRFHPGVNGGQ